VLKVDNYNFLGYDTVCLRNILIVRHTTHALPTLRACAEDITLVISPKISLPPGT